MRHVLSNAMIDAIETGSTEVRARLAKELRDAPTKTLTDFRAALTTWGEENPPAKRGALPKEWLTRRALFAAWWFIENVTEDDPSRSDIFFVVRDLVHGAQG